MRVECGGSPPTRGGGARAAVRRRCAGGGGGRGGHAAAWACARVVVCGKFLEPTLVLSVAPTLVSVQVRVSNMNVRASVCRARVCVKGGGGRQQLPAILLTHSCPGSRPPRCRSRCRCPFALIWYGKEECENGCCKMCCMWKRAHVDQLFSAGTSVPRTEIRVKIHTPAGPSSRVEQRCVS